VKKLSGFLIIMCLVSAPVLGQNPEKPKTPDAKSPAFQLTWVDIAFTHNFPIPGTRFADFPRMNFGGSLGLNFMVAGIKPLWLFLNIMADANLPNTNRMDRLIDFGIGAGLGWRVTLVKDWFYFTPRISYGYMLHWSYGDYFNDQRIYLISDQTGKKRNHLFSDQYLEYGLEFAVDVSPRPAREKVELFLMPQLIHFIEIHRQGLEAGYKLGIRAHIDTHDSSEPAIRADRKELPPTILAGRVLDAETGKILQQVIPSVTGGKTGKADRAAGETFAFTVDAGRDYSLKAEHEGYEPLTHEVNRAAIIPNKKNTLTLTMKPTRVWGMFGHVYEKESNDPLKNVEVIVTETATSNKVEMATDGKGDFRMELKPNSDYDVILKKRKYFTVRGTFSTRGRMPGWFDVNKFMRTEFQKVVIGAIVEFGNIFYDSGSWYIRPDVVPALDKIAGFLNDNPTIVVELGAHTDSMGDAGQNMVLSQKRAQSAVEYLINKGIKPERITAQGYGETKIKNRCVDGVVCSAEEHQANRRTEIKVMKITR
jgi:outer membrane protein OmpA-like peptidoglycan-associated protein